MKAEATEFWKSSTVATAQKAIDKDAPKPLSVDDYMKAEEAKKAEAEANTDKKPVIKNGKFVCANQGCTSRYFTDEENNDTACNSHKGKPVFHDVKKYWDCCEGTVTYDWDDF